MVDEGPDPPPGAAALSSFAWKTGSDHGRVPAVGAGFVFCRDQVTLTLTVNFLPLPSPAVTVMVALPFFVSGRISTMASPSVS